MIKWIQKGTFDSLFWFKIIVYPLFDTNFLRERRMSKFTRNDYRFRHLYMYKNCVRGIVNLL